MHHRGQQIPSVRAALSPLTPGSRPQLISELLPTHLPNYFQSKQLLKPSPSWQVALYRHELVSSSE